MYLVILQAFPHGPISFRALTETCYRDAEQPGQPIQVLRVSVAGAVVTHQDFGSGTETAISSLHASKTASKERSGSLSHDVVPAKERLWSK